MIHSIVDALVGLAAVVGILAYFGVKPKQFPEWKIMPLSRKWKLGVMLLLVAVSLGMSGYSFYRSLRPLVIIKTVEAQVSNTDKFTWDGHPYPSKQVFGKVFRNQEVPLDDIAYFRCTFENVTLVYNGSGPFELGDNNFTGPTVVTSSNHAVANAFALTYIFSTTHLHWLSTPGGEPLVPRKSTRPE